MIRDPRSVELLRVELVARDVGQRHATVGVDRRRVADATAVTGARERRGNGRDELCGVVVVGERDDGDDRDAADGREDEELAASTSLPDRFVDRVAVCDWRHVVDSDGGVAVGRH